MKTILLFVSILGSLTFAYGQNIDDNKVQFSYIQLPYFKIDKAFSNYDVKFVHGYEQSNQEIMAAHELNKKAAMDIFEQAMIQFKIATDSIDVNYYRAMAKWEKDVNAGKTQANGHAIPQPIRQPYPTIPVFPGLDAPRLNSPMEENAVLNGINIQGFQKGFGGFVVTVNIMGLSDVQINESKKGSGATTKYTYTATYQLPVEITVETPTQGKLIHMRILEGRQSHNIGTYDSKYEHEANMITNKDRFYRDLENSARARAIAETNNYLNDQIGYVNRTRNAELYAVKRYKSYDYSDVTVAYTKTVQALMLVSQDRDRSSAVSKIDEALAEWKMILEESNTYDNKARINDKITAMIYCNMAELQAWKGDFDQSQINVNLAITEGGKFKRHAQGEQSFYADQKKRWDVHY